MLYTDGVGKTPPRTMLDFTIDGTGALTETSTTVGGQ